MLMFGYLSIFSGIEISIFRDVLPDAVCRFAKIAPESPLGQKRPEYLARASDERNTVISPISDRIPDAHIGPIPGMD